MQFKLCAPILALVLILSGCQSGKAKMPNQKAEAQKRWASARAQVLGSLANDQFKTGNFEKSQKTLEEAQRLDPENAQLRILYAKLSIEQGKLDEADRELTVARKLEPLNAEVDYLSGIIYQRWQKPQTALDYYSSAAEKDTREVAYVMAQAEMMVVLGRSDEALELLQGNLDRFSTSSAIHQAIGQLLMAQGDYGASVEALRQAQVLAGDDDETRENLAMAYFYNRQYRESAEQISQLVSKEKHATRSDLYIALGECQLNINRVKEARVNFDKATELNPSSAVAWLSVTKASLQADDLRRAEAALRKAISLSPDTSDTQLMVGYVRLRQKRLDEALGAFQRASTLDPQDSVSVCMIGLVYERMGKPQQAAKQYAQALRLKPGDELASKLMASVETGEQR